jgi:hypothetical protein
MAAGDTMQGRRLPDVRFGDLPEDLRPGDYWRYLDRETGEPMDAGDDAHANGNLTRGVWGIYAPRGGIGTLRLHTVREEDDGTISVRRDDGSSNSILISYRDTAWHGYLERGVWREV